MSKENRSGVSIITKRWIPVGGLIILTVALIIFFKNESIYKIVDEQKNNLVDYYTKNLKPLFARTPITNEDVYNFAMNNELPLDKNNKQYLKLGDESAQNKYFEFIKNPAAQNNNTFGNFKKSFRLDKYENQKLDSILESYRDKLKKQIFINDNNTVAINSNLWNLNKAIRADLLMFASEANKEKFKKLYPKFYTVYKDPALQKFVDDAKEAGDSNYIFVTPDSVFSSVYYVDNQKLNKEIEEMNKNVKDWEKDYKVHIALQNEMFDKQKKVKNQQFRIYIDSNLCRIVIPSISIPPIKIPDMDRLIAGLNETQVKVENLRERIKSKNKKIAGMNDALTSVPEVPENPEKYELNIDLPDLKDLIVTSVSAGLNALRVINIPNVNVDSIMEIVNAEIEDSLGHYDKKEFKVKMEKLRRKLEKLKEEKNNN
jgi:hypothetical protein